MSFLTIGFVILPMDLGEWSFVLGVSILVMFPTWAEVSHRIYCYISQFVDERVVAVERVDSSLAALEMNTVRSPAHVNNA